MSVSYRQQPNPSDTFLMSRYANPIWPLANNLGQSSEKSWGGDPKRFLALRWASHWALLLHVRTFLVPRCFWGNWSLIRQTNLICLQSGHSQRIIRNTFIFKCVSWTVSDKAPQLLGPSLKCRENQRISNTRYFLITRKPEIQSRHFKGMKTIKKKKERKSKVPAQRNSSGLQQIMVMCFAGPQWVRQSSIPSYVQHLHIWDGLTGNCLVCDRLSIHSLFIVEITLKFKASDNLE